jgi:tRNA A37 methylthiotransferase MiaB
MPSWASTKSRRFPTLSRKPWRAAARNWPSSAAPARAEVQKEVPSQKRVGAPNRPSWTTPPPPVNVNLRPSYIPDFATPRFRLTPKHFAYVKIAEGCNHPCSFCIIPRMRGSHRSRGQSDIVREARQLIAEGVKELNLISQDSTYYGLDLRAGQPRAISSPEKFTAAAHALPADASTLCTLLRELNDLAGRFLDSPALHASGPLDR